MIIRAPSRIHMSLIDLNGSYRRVDGGIGLALADPQFVLEVEQIESGIELEFADTVTDEEAILECEEKIPDAAKRTIEHFDIDAGFKFIVHQTYPPHSGFGSGTQIAVSTAHLITETMGIEAESRELSTIVGRGGTSGIGTYTHDLGGFIVDGGHSKEEKPLFLPSGASKAKPATLIARYDFPEEWNILIAIPYIEKHMEGDDEVDVFQTYCPIPKEEVEQVSHLILMNLIPFMLEKDIKNFGWAVSELQKVGFNKLEHSLDASYLPTMKAIEDAGAYGVGISSFGPVLYTMFDESNADIVEKTKEIIGDKGTVFVTKAQNHGFVIEKIDYGGLMGFLSRFKSKKIDFISVSKPQAEPLKIVFKVDGKHIKEYEFCDVPFEVRKALMDEWDNDGVDASIAYFKSDIQGKYQCKKLSERN